jgi:hypothetical protein
MRLWSLHPRYLDAQGLVALWREGLLAQAVLAGQTRGYTRHPQLARFRASLNPPGFIAEYLRHVQAEAARRGYRFDRSKIGAEHGPEPLTVTRGQLEYEWRHLAAKLSVRSPAWLRALGTVEQPEPHSLFEVVEGGVADWEVTAGGAQPSRAQPDV